MLATAREDGEPAFQILFEKVVLGPGMGPVFPFLRVAVRETISHTLILHCTLQAVNMLCDL